MTTRFTIHNKMTAEAAVEPETEGERKLREGMEEARKRKEQEIVERKKANRAILRSYKIK